MSLRDVIYKAGVFVLAYSGIFILFASVVWLLLPDQARAAWQAWHTAFSLPVLLPLIGAVGLSKWIDKLVRKK